MQVYGYCSSFCGLLWPELPLMQDLVNNPGVPAVSEIYYSGLWGNIIIDLNKVDVELQIGQLYGRLYA